MDKAKAFVMLLLFGVMSVGSIGFVLLLVLGKAVSLTLGLVAAVSLVLMCLVGLTIKDSSVSD